MMSVPPQGLEPISHNRRKDWKHKNRASRLLFGTTNPKSLPLTLGRIPLPVEDQNITSLCTEMGSSKAGGYLWGVDMSPDFQGAAESRYAGAAILNGTDPKTTMNTAVLTGFLPKPLAPYTLAQDGEIVTTDWTKYSPALWMVAAKYAISAWLDISEDATDIFDSIRIALYDSQAEGAVVQVFGNWYQEWSDAGNARKSDMPMPMRPPIALHDYIFIDFVEYDGVQKVKAQLSSGTDFGENGFLYFERDVINFAFKNMVEDGTGLYIYRKSDARLAQLISIGYALLGRAQALLARLQAK